MIWLLVLAVLAACGGSGGGSDHGTDSKVPQADFLIGAGLTQGWYLHPKEIVDANADAGLTFTEIEWVSDQDLASCPHGSPRTDDYFGVDPATATTLIEHARQRGVTVLINIVNANNCAVMAQSDSWFLDQLEQVLVLGYDHVLISPVSEPWASPSKAEHWIELARRKVRRENLVAPGGAFRDVHYCDPGRMLADLVRGDSSVIHNTDCSTNLDPGPMVTTMFAKAAKETHSPVMIYDFYSRDLSSLQASITAMGNAAR